jgi:hypothetical protein
MLFFVLNNLTLSTMSRRTPIDFTFLPSVSTNFAIEFVIILEIFQYFYFANSPFMARRKFRAQENVHYFSGIVFVYKIGAEAQNICVIVLPCEPRYFRRPAIRSADASDLICGYAHSNSASANQYPESALRRGHILRHASGVVRIVNGFLLRKSPIVKNIHIIFLQSLYQKYGQSIPPMIISNANFHSPFVKNFKIDSIAEFISSRDLS